MHNSKFTDSLDVTDWQVETDTGWESITHIHQTVPFKIWIVSTKDFTLKCADEHIIMDEFDNQIFVMDLKVGDRVKTVSGIQDIVSIVETEDDPVNMYDVTIDSKNHTLFTDGILSHNTTVSSIFLLHTAIFSEEEMTVAVLANKEKTAFEILQRIKMAFQFLPLWLQQGIDEGYGGWNKSSVGFENGVRILAGSTASSSIRGYTIKLLYLDEFAFVPDNIADQFMTSVYPTIVSGKTSKIIICSTPNGMNFFYTIWKKAIVGENGYMPIKVHWSEIPGQDEEWKKNIIRDIGPQKFAQEFDGQFLGSTSTLIDAYLLEKMELKDPVELKLGTYFAIYEQPIPKTTYILGVDSAKGTGKDYSVTQVLKVINEHDFEQVAVYRNNVIEARDYAQVIISISKYYNGCHIMIENNDVGGEVANAIHYEYEYDKILLCDKKGIGILSTKKTKLAANLLLKRYMENGWLGICDRQTLYEMSRYEEVRPNVFECPKGIHDDSVSSLMWALYYVSTVFFDGKKLDMNKIDERFMITKQENEDMPIMIIDDGGMEDPETQWDVDEGVSNDLDEEGNDFWGNNDDMGDNRNKDDFEM